MKSSVLVLKGCLKTVTVKITYQKGMQQLRVSNVQEFTPG